MASRQIAQAYHAFSLSHEAFTSECDSQPDQFETQYNALIDLLRQSGANVDKADLLYEAVVSRILEREDEQNGLNSL